MGLTLNTNSLTIPSTGSSAASGLSTSDVTTLIKNNTPYQFITKVDGASSSTILCSNVFSASDGFSSYKVLLNDFSFSTNMSYIYMQLEVDGSIVGTEYAWSMAKDSGSGGSFSRENGNDSKWRLYNSDISNGLLGYIDFTNTSSGTKAVGTWHIGGSKSTRHGGYAVGGGCLNNTGQITGFQIIAQTGNFPTANIRIYGVNNV